MILFIFQIKCFMARVTFTYKQTLMFFVLECTLSLMINNRNPQFYNCTLLLYLMWYCSIVEIPLRFIWHKTTACAPGSWQAKRTPQIFEGESFLAFFLPPTIHSGSLCMILTTKCKAFSLANQWNPNLFHKKLFIIK